MKDGSTAFMEQLCAVVSADLPGQIAAWDLSQFGSEQYQNFLLVLLLKCKAAFQPTTDVDMGHEFDIGLTEPTTAANLECPWYKKWRVGKEMEWAAMQKLLEREILEPSMSPLATNNVPVRKEDMLDGSNGGMRIPSDMQKLNSITVGDLFPAMDFKEMTSWLSSKRFFSTPDARGGHYNVRMMKEARPLTTVREVLGLIQREMMTMGLKKAAAVVQRLINRIYDGFQ